MKQLTLIKKDGQPLAHSRDVAEMIGKEHNMLMRSIRQYVGILTSAELHPSDFFIPSYYQDAKKEQRPCFLLTKKGCDMVANKMTGEKGVLFTAEYVTRFEEMQKELQKQSAQQLPGNYKEALLQLVKEVEEKEMLQLENRAYQNEIASNRPKVEYVDEVLKSTDLMITSQIAEDYGMSAQGFNQLLKKHGVQYKKNGQWLLYSKHKGNGYTKSETHTFNKTDGTPAARVQSKWTQKGRLFIYELLKTKGILPTMEQMKLELIEGGK
ncbi:phage antirepressor KilAC domain-containing protein [Halobacillus aidingensis]|uniref:Phage regulatory protein, rha family n=1 Tax=Halobacillus aidingensis TaxID=240303 RepID=A0A1H0MIZ9_HALAD|nr:phage antirepressor KilAC domain-containing protein [Halobacillus aidingensis]SDO80423.1 phage regulatory protein, rha family [Halobacillus aidingensis]